MSKILNWQPCPRCNIYMATYFTEQSFPHRRPDVVFCPICGLVTQGGRHVPVTRPPSATNLPQNTMDSSGLLFREMDDETEGLENSPSGPKSR